MVDTECKALFIFSLVTMIASVVLIFAAENEYYLINVPALVCMIGSVSVIVRVNLVRTNVELANAHLFTVSKKAFCSSRRARFQH